MKDAGTRRRSLAVLLCFAAIAGAQLTPQKALVDLGGTSWQLGKFQGSDDKTLVPDDKTKYTIAFESNGRVSVRIDCNRGHGRWKSSVPNQLEFGPLALTRAMCPPAPLNNRIARDWQYVRSYILKDNHLFLSLMADGGIYEFEPGPRQPGGQLRGTATYRERMALPPNAMFVASLEDISRGDAPAEVIGQAQTDHPGVPPISFEIKYDPSRIDPSHRYVVRARVLVEGKPFFATVRPYRVLRPAQSSKVTLLLQRVKAPTASLENTYWRLTRLGEESVPVASRQKESRLILNSKTHRVSGSGGCNLLAGGYELKGDQLKLTQMTRTMMACLEGMETEDAFLQALEKVKRWKIAGSQLDLFDSSGKLVARFEPSNMNP